MAHRVTDPLRKNGLFLFFLRMMLESLFGFCHHMINNAILQEGIREMVSVRAAAMLDLIYLGCNFSDSLMVQLLCSSHLKMTIQKEGLLHDALIKISLSRHPSFS